MTIDQKIVEEALKQIDLALEKVRLATRGFSPRRNFSDLPEQTRAELLTLIMATIERLTPIASAYKRNAGITIKYQPEGNRYFLSEAVRVLRALRADYEKGHLASLPELVHSDLFSDFLEQAEYLLEESWKDPAAVIAGGVLEEHLKNLYEKNKIDTDTLKKGKKEPKRASAINDELKRNEVYGKLEHSQVDSWLKLRNHAAHGEYGEYDHKQVGNMISGIRNFIARHPA